MPASNLATGKPERKFREEIREKEGKGFIAKRVVNEVRDLASAGQHKIILDGLYSWSEYKILKHEFPGEMTVIAIVTPKHIRKQRMAKRPERPMTSDEVDQRDWAEIEGIEKGGPIAIADYFIHNDKDLDNLHKQMDEVLHTLISRLLQRTRVLTARSCGPSSACVLRIRSFLISVSTNASPSLCPMTLAGSSKIPRLRGASLLSDTPNAMN